MSENWNKKHLHNRLDSLFSDLGDNDNIPGLSIFDQLTGWMWEIDLKGLLTNLSPDIETHLGYDPATLIGQGLSKISTFNLADLDLPTDPATTEPAMHKFTFFRVDGGKHTATCQVMPLHNQEQELVGWRGITLTEERKSQSLAALSSDQDLLDRDFSLPLSDLLTPEQIAANRIPVPSPSTNGEGKRISTGGKVPPADILSPEMAAFDDDLELAAYQPSEQVKNFLLEIDSDPDRVWEFDEIQLVEQVHDQLELALENANLFQQTQEALSDTDEQARKLRLLNEMSELLSQTETPDRIYQIAADTASKVFKAVQANIAIWDDNRETMQVVAAFGPGSDEMIGNKIPRDSSTEIFWKPVLENRVSLISEVDQHDVQFIKSQISGPIFVRGEVFGTIGVFSSTPGFYKEQDETFMVQLLSILNASLENRDLLDGIQRALASTEEQARRLAVLNQLSEGLGQANTMDEVIRLTMEKMDSIIPCKVCTTAIYNHELDAYLTYQITQNTPFGEPTLENAQNTLVRHISQEKQLISDYDFSTNQFEDGRRWVEDLKVTSIIGAPLMSGETVMGTIIVGNPKEFSYSLQDEALLLSISSLLASTLDNRQLFQQIQRRSTQLETSAEVSRIASTILDINELLPEVVERIRTGFNLYYAGIFLVDDTGQYTGEPGKWAVLRAGTGSAGQRMMEAGHKLDIAGSSMIGAAISKAEAQVAMDVGTESSHFRNPDLPDTRSEISLPLRSRGRVMGAISIQSDQEAAFSQEDVTSLQTMTDQLANAIENARLFEQTEVRAKELMVLNEMARAYTQTMDVETLFEHTFTYTNQLLYAENFYLALFNDRDNTVRFRLFLENGEKIAPPEPMIMLGNGLTDWIILNKVPALIPKDVDKELVTMGIEPRGESAKAYLGVPMMIGRDVLGVIAIQSYEDDKTYTQRDLEMLTAISSQAAVAIDNALRFQQTQAKAQFEQVLREITTRVHSTSNPEVILKTAVREVSHALGRDAFIELAAIESEIGTGANPKKETKPEDPMNPKTQPIPKLRRDEE